MVKNLTIAAHAIVGWAWCGALIGVGSAWTSMDNTLITHGIGAPIGFALISLFYFRRFAFTNPLSTALIFLLIVLALDLFVVALLIQGSFAMFRSPLGTWIPLALIFVSTYATGTLLQERSR